MIQSLPTTIGVLLLKKGDIQWVAYAPLHNIRAWGHNIIADSVEEEGKTISVCYHDEDDRWHAIPVSEMMNRSEEEVLTDTLRVIAQEVAETKSTYYNDVDGRMYCPFCNAEQFSFADPFPHEDNCIITKARTLVKNRVKEVKQL